MTRYLHRNQQAHILQQHAQVENRSKAFDIRTQTAGHAYICKQARITSIQPLSTACTRGESIHSIRQISQAHKCVHTLINPTSNGALSASSTTSTQPLSTACTRGESVHSIRPPETDGCTVSDCTVVSLCS